jgi:hypothetical protein
MGSSDWVAVDVNDSGGLVVSADSFVGTGSEDSSSLKFAENNNLTANEFHLYRYNGAQAAQFPAQYLRMSAAIYGVDNIAYRTRWGFYLLDAALTGTVATGDLHGLSFTPYRQYSSTPPTIEMKGVNNGSRTTINYTTSFTPPVVTNNWIQYELALMIRSGFAPDTDEFALKVFSRYNAGSQISAPGSTGWTSWSTMYDNSVALSSEHTTYLLPLKSGAYAYFGYGGAEGGSLTYGDLYFDDVRVSYGSIT